MLVTAPISVVLVVPSVACNAVPPPTLLSDLEEFERFDVSDANAVSVFTTDALIAVEFASLVNEVAADDNREVADDIATMVIEG